MQLFRRRQPNPSLKSDPTGTGQFKCLTALIPFLRSASCRRQDRLASFVRRNPTRTNSFPIKSKGILVTPLALRWLGFAILDIPLFIGLGWLFFDGWSDFFNNLRLVLTPDFIALLRGEFWASRESASKIFSLFGLCLIILACEYLFLHKHKPETTTKPLFSNISCIIQSNDPVRTTHEVLSGA